MDASGGTCTDVCQSQRQAAPRLSEKGRRRSALTTHKISAVLSVPLIVTPRVWSIYICLRMHQSVSLIRWPWESCTLYLQHAELLAGGQIGYPGQLVRLHVPGTNIALHRVHSSHSAVQRKHKSRCGLIWEAEVWGWGEERSAGVLSLLQGEKGEGEGILQDAWIELPARELPSSRDQGVFLGGSAEEFCLHT